MRVRCVWGAARRLCGRPALGPPRRPVSGRAAALEELFAPDGPLRSFLERQAGAGSPGLGGRPQVAAAARLLSAKERELRETEALLRDENEDLRKLAENEITLCQKEILQLKQQIVVLLVPSEEADENDLILEVTAGVGGQEAMLFTSEVFDMYQKYAAFKRWHFETLDYFPSEIGGLRHASASIGGPEAYRHLKYEGGVHRVQRVPKTERQGRIHTSTMTVAILPQPTEPNQLQERVKWNKWQKPSQLRVTWFRHLWRSEFSVKDGRLNPCTIEFFRWLQEDVKRQVRKGRGNGDFYCQINLVINPKDLRIDTKRASGAGGQHVNTTDSAVRIVHLPTGIASECQQERSQLKNREMAMKKLRAKLYSLRLEEETSKRYSARKVQVGTKGRSEKIRTYNFPQNRVTDHRINKSIHELETFMQGDDQLDELIQSLKDYADYESLLEIISKKA